MTGRTSHIVSRRHRQDGMTLIEVMLAMAILGMIGTMIYGAFVQMAQHKQRVEEDIERSHEVERGLDRMARELSMAFVSAHVNPNMALQSTVTAFVGSERMGGSRLDFTSFSHQRLRRDAHESDQNELSYFVADHPTDRSKKVLARREQRRIDDDPRKGGQTQILIDNVVRLELSYLDPLSGEWIRTWDTTQAASQPNRLPAQVKIVLTVRDHRRDGRTQTYATRAALPLQYALNHAIYPP